jgi:hypothetical protein
LAQTVKQSKKAQTSLPASVAALLEMNKSGAVSEVARLTILQNHFITDSISLESFIDETLDLQIKLAPFLLSWLGKDYHRQAPLYNFIRNKALLFELHGDVSPMG